MISLLSSVLNRWSLAMRLLRLTMSPMLRAIFQDIALEQIALIFSSVKAPQNKKKEIGSSSRFFG
jgi:hypothetical protein